MHVKLLASFQLLLSIPLLLLQLITLPIFLCVREFRSRICFRVMFGLGIADSIQLLIAILFSFFVIIEINLGTTFERICGAFMQLSWDVVIFHHFLLGTNRLLIFAKASFMPSVLRKEPKSEQILFNALLMLVWALFFTLIITFQMTPNLGVHFDHDRFAFFLDLSLPWMPTFRLFEFYWSCFLLPATTIAYLAIVVLLKKYRKVSSSVLADGKTTRTVPPLLNKQEWRILGQSVAMFLMMSALISVWSLTELLSWNPSEEVVFLNVFVFLLFCGINPILYLTTLPEFRQHFCRLLCGCLTTAPSPQLAAFQSTGNVSSSVSVIGMVGRRKLWPKTQRQSMANGGRTTVGTIPQQ